MLSAKNLIGKKNFLYGVVYTLEPHIDRLLKTTSTAYVEDAVELYGRVVDRLLAEGMGLYDSSNASIHREFERGFNRMPLVKNPLEKRPIDPLYYFLPESIYDPYQLYIEYRNIGGKGYAYPSGQPYYEEASTIYPFRHKSLFKNSHYFKICDGKELLEIQIGGVFGEKIILLYYPDQDDKTTYWLVTSDVNEVHGKPHRCSRMYPYSERPFPRPKRDKVEQEISKIMMDNAMRSLQATLAKPQKPAKTKSKSIWTRFVDWLNNLD